MATTSDKRLNSGLRYRPREYDESDRYLCRVDRLEEVGDETSDPAGLLERRRGEHDAKPAVAHLASRNRTSVPLPIAQSHAASGPAFGAPTTDGLRLVRDRSSPSPRAALGRPRAVQCQPPALTCHCGRRARTTPLRSNLTIGRPSAIYSVTLFIVDTGRSSGRSRPDSRRGPQSRVLFRNSHVRPEPRCPTPLRLKTRFHHRPGPCGRHQWGRIRTQRCHPIRLPPGIRCTGSGGACMNARQDSMISKSGKSARTSFRS